MCSEPGTLGECPLGHFARAARVPDSHRRPESRAWPLLTTAHVSLCVAGPLHQPGHSAQALLRPHPAERHLGALLRRQLQRHPEEIQEHGCPGLWLPLASWKAGPLGPPFLDPATHHPGPRPTVTRSQGTGRLVRGLPVPLPNFNGVGALRI